jgi:hypothetical protein
MSWQERWRHPYTHIFLLDLLRCCGERQRVQPTIEVVDAIVEWSVVNGSVFVFYGDGGEFRGEPVDRWLRELEASGVRKYIGATGLSFELSGDTRKRCNALLKAQQIAFVTITDSALVRGFTTAASWFGVNIAAFAWANLNEAMTWLQLDPQTALAAMSAVKTNKYSVDQKLAARSRR